MTGRAQRGDGAGGAKGRVLPGGGGPGLRRGGDPALHVMDADGSDVRPLGDFAGRPWNPRRSPDGRRIAFYETDAEGEDHVYPLEPDGAGRTRIGPGVWPTWSPDASAPIFTRGRDLRRVEVAGGAPDAPRPFVEDSIYGALSPDGSRLALIRDAGGTIRVLLARADGSGARTVLERPGPAWD